MSLAPEAHYLAAAQHARPRAAAASPAREHSGAMPDPIIASQVGRGRQGRGYLLIKDGDWLWSRARADAVRDPRKCRNISK